MKIDAETIEILEQCTTDKNKLFLPDIQLDRKLYVKANKVLEALEGKWNRKERAHLFNENVDASILLGNVILSGEVTDIKKELQFFPTPEKIIDILIKKSNVKKGMKVLEPSAGKGSIAKKLKEMGCKVTVCEKHEPFRKELIDDGFSVLQNKDFLTVGPSVFDAVVANPPFTLQQDIDHVLHMIKFVKEGGIVASVMSNGVTFRKNKKALNFHKTMDEKCISWEIIELPKDSFKESGTMVSAIIVVAQF